MAIYNGRILMRKGNEADFDASKLMSGEWAVSLDAGIVRICLEAGKVIRMATYEAFEEDMKQIEAILLECQTVEEAVQRINAEINTKLEAVVEYVGQAKIYRDEALQFRNEAEAFKNQAGEIAGIGIATNEKAGIVKPDGETLEVDADGTMRVIGGGGVSDYKELDNKPSINGTELDGEMSLENLGIASATELEKTNTKVDTIIEKADLGIKETASGEEIHLTDSAEGKAVEFALFGKARQNTTSGKNLCEPRMATATLNGMSCTNNGDGTFTLSGTPSANCTFRIDQSIFNAIDNLKSYSGEYSISMVKNKDSDVKVLLMEYKDGNYVGLLDSATKPTDTINTESAFVYVYCTANVDYTGVTFAIQLEKNSVITEYEPYTNGASPNPDYPQEIEVSGESYNLLENIATSQTINGVEFVVNEDKSISINGTYTDAINIEISKHLEVDLLEDNVDYVLSGGDANAKIFMNLRDSSDRYIKTITQQSGSGFVFNKSLLLATEGCALYNFGVFVPKESTHTNTIIYPMIRKASVKNDRYMPYGKGSVEVKSVGKNLLKNTATSKTIGNVTFTVNENKSIVANGQSVQSGNWLPLIENTYFKKGKYLLNGSPNVSGCVVQVRTSLTPYISFEATLKEKEFEITDELSQRPFNVYIGTKGVATVDNVTFYPMIRACDENGNPIGDDIYEPYKETLSTIPTPNGLAGIKVSSNGNYTDQNGQQWICDEIVKYADGSGKKIERIKHYSLAIADMNNSNDFPGWINVDDLENTVGSNVIITGVKNTMLNIGTEVSVNTENNNNMIYLRKSVYGLTQAEWKTNYPDLIVDIYVPRFTPIETPLTAEEIAEISTFYPITNISNDFDCGMKVTYNCDSKNYIDKQLAKMERAREQAMMNMFLLLPEETQATMIENDVNNLLTESEN